MTSRNHLKTFDKVYNETYDKTLKRVIINCSNMDDVNDIIQDIYFDFYKALKRKSDILDINAYLYGIVNKKIKKYYSLKYKLISKLSFSVDENNYDTLEDTIDLESELISKESINEIWKYLDTKKEIVRKIFYLYYFMDVPIKEIANGLGLNESNVKNYLYRTLKEIRKDEKNV